MNHTIPDRVSRKRDTMAFTVALVSGIFAVVMSILLIANYVQTKTVDPLNSAAMAQLMEKLSQNPQDQALKEQIRALDLLARKAYFTHKWQIRTGTYSLFVAVVLFLIMLKYLNSSRTRLPDLKQDTDPEEKSALTWLSRRYVMVTGITLFALAFLAGVLSQTYLSVEGGERFKKRLPENRGPEAEEINRNWPGFRGPGGLGIAYVTDAPIRWDGKSGQNILWKTPLPYSGYNSPVIWQKYLFLSAADRKNQAILCFDVETGKILWQADLNDIPGSPAKKPRVSNDTGYAAPTLATDGQRILGIFATGDMACLDFKGQRLWVKNLGVPDNHYGHSSSLITHQDIVLVQLDHNKGGRLLALHSATGRVIYERARDVQISWASPILVNTGQRTEIILNANPFVIAHDPRTGRELWRVECMSGEVAPSPAYADGRVFVVNDNARLVAIRLAEKPAIAWEYDDDLSDVPSPVAKGDLLWVPTGYGVVACYDATNGKQHWFHEFDEGFYASPILAGDKLYLVDVMGLTSIIKADRTFQLIQQNQLGEKVVATPAFFTDRIYIRGRNHLFCIGKKK